MSKPEAPQAPRARVVGLDLSLATTGLARPAGSTIPIRPGPIDGYGRNHAIALQVMRAIRRAAPDLVVIEGYALGTHSLALVRAAELGGYVRTMLTVAGYPWVDLNPMTLKKWAIGNGNATKTDMVDAALKRGCDPVETDDEADAYLARCWGLDLLTLLIPEGT